MSAPRADGALAGPLGDPVAALRACLADAAQRCPSIAQVSSLGPEDMVITDLIARDRLPIPVITLDTGRLPIETYTQIAEVRRRYAPLGLALTVVFPSAAAVEAVVNRDGIDGFYDSVTARKSCCDARKVQPLARALLGRRGWITGLRRAQSVERADIAVQETEALTGGDGTPYTRLKLNPLAAWTDDQIWTYLRAHDVPVNTLHARGYPSIGCAPCTRAVAPGEDQRAGRWWWEAANVKECGLHVSADGRLRRARPDPQPFTESIAP